MKAFYKIGLIIFLLFSLLIFFFLPIKEAFVFIETRTNKENIFYLKLNEPREFQVRYVHSIHLTNVIERYEVTEDKQIRFVSMSYENVSIGLPGDAGEGETIELKDGIYTLTYDHRIVDSFRLHIGRVDADLALRYNHKEVDLKAFLQRGKSYTFSVKKLSLYQLMKGEDLSDSK